MKTRKLSLAAAAFVLGAVVSHAMADHPPGYMYGLYNCGPGVYNSETRCQLCCDDAVYFGQLPAADVMDCYDFCGDACFCTPTGWRLWLWLASVLA